MVASWFLPHTCIDKQEICDRGWCPFIYITEKPFISKKKKKEMEGWLNASLKNTETRDELLTTCNPMSR